MIGRHGRRRGGNALLVGAAIIKVDIAVKHACMGLEPILHRLQDRKLG